jgi:hypothetical protein
MVFLLFFPTPTWFPLGRRSLSAVGCGVKYGGAKGRLRRGVGRSPEKTSNNWEIYTKQVVISYLFIWHMGYIGLQIMGCLTNKNTR